MAQYPDSAAENHEEGKVLIHVVIGPSGASSEVKLGKSSGFSDLDEAAIKQVKEHRLWQPPKPGCTEISVGFIWSLGLLSRTNTKKHEPDAMSKALMDYPPK